MLGGIVLMKTSTLAAVQVGCNGRSCRWQLPLGLVVHPMNPAGRPVAVSSMGSAGIVRCKRCRTYINPFVTWTDGGRCGCHDILLQLCIVP